MSSEVFDGSKLLESVELLQSDSEQVAEDLLNGSGLTDEANDSDDEELKVESLQRYHLAGAALKVTPFKNLSDHIHQVLLSNSSFSDGVPILAQYLTPLLMAECDTLVVAPSGRRQVEALLIPIINKILMSLVDGMRMFDRRPRAVLLSSNSKERLKIKQIVDALITDLPIVAAEIVAIDKLVQFFEEDNEVAKLDILITSPAAYIAFTCRRKVNKNEGARPVKDACKIFLDKLLYLVIFEMEETLDSGGEYAKIIENQRREKQFTLVMQTHTSFTNRGKDKKIAFEYAERRSKLENCMNDEYGLVMIDSTLCMNNLVLLMTDEFNKVEYMRSILQEHMDNTKNVENDTGLKFKRRVLIVVSNDDRARFVKTILTSGGKYHKRVISPEYILHLEKEQQYGPGKWNDPMMRIRKGQVMVVITSNIHNVRMAHSVIDKIIFFDIIPNMDKLVLNCSKIVDNRRNFFLLDPNDLIEKRDELKSFVQYLKDVDTDIPEILLEFETIPASTRSIFV